MLNHVVSLDLIGAINYPRRANQIVAHVHKNFPSVQLNIGLLANASGWSETRYIPLIKNIIKKPNICSIRLHALWEDSHVFTEAHIPKARKIGQELQKIAKANPHVKFYFSPCLEHTMNLALTKKFYDACQFPNLTYVNSPIKNGAKLPNVINEHHHTLIAGKAGDIFSFDGLDQLDAEMNKFKDIHRKSDYFYSWSWFCNSKASKKDTTKRQDRKLLPQLRMIDVMVYQALEAYPPSHKLQSGRIYKAYAEAHLDSKGQADSRSYSITYLTSGDRLPNGNTAYPNEILFKAKGKTLLRLTYSGTTHGKQRIYRNLSNPFALDLWHDALELNKRGMVNVWEDKKRVGRVMPLFRCGEYRNIDV